MKFIPNNLKLTYITVIDLHNIASHTLCVELKEGSPEQQIRNILKQFAAQHEIPTHTNTYMCADEDIDKYHNGTVKVELNTTEVHVIYELNVALTYTCEL